MYKQEVINKGVSNINVNTFELRQGAGWGWGEEEGVAGGVKFVTTRLRRLVCVHVHSTIL